MNQEKNTTADALWQEIKTVGAVGHTPDIAFLRDRPFTNLTEVLGIGTHDGINRMMRMSGVEEVNISGGASDYDKLEALCKVLPLWSGHPYYASIHTILKEILGVTEPLRQNALPTLWRETAEYLLKNSVTPRTMAKHFGVGRTVAHVGLAEWDHLVIADLPQGVDLRLYVTNPIAELWELPQGFQISAKNAAQDMTDRIADLLDSCSAKGCRGVTVALSALKAFVRPNPYTPAQAVLKLQKGERPTEEDMALILCQTLRLLGGECVRRGWSMMLLDLPEAVAVPLLDYLKGCGCLPQTAVITEAMDEMLLRGVSPYLSAKCCDAPDLLTSRISHAAERIPLGCLGGLYMPLNGAIDLPLWREAQMAACRCVADFGATGKGTEQMGEQMDVLRRILC